MHYLSLTSSFDLSTMFISQAPFLVKTMDG